jgi:hypothetical protein
MKKTIVFAVVTSLLSFGLTAADSGPKDQLAKAAAKLGEAPSYSWHTTVKVPEDSQFKPGPTEGKTEKGGFTHVKMSFNNNESEMVLKGDKAALTSRDGGWELASELENAEGPGRFRAMMARNFRAPAAQVTEILSGIKEVKKEGDTYSGDLTEEGAKKLLSFRGRAGGDGPTVTNPKGSAKFWLKDGALVKYEFHVSGTISFNGNDFDSDRATTVEIKDVGATKVDAPEEAKKKLS